MIFFVCSILLSCTISLLFKLFDKYRVDLLPAIAINYLTCVFTGLALSNGQILPDGASPMPQMLIAITLGAMFLIAFYLSGVITRKSGITVAVISLRLSLVIPVVLSIFIYGDIISPLKWLGILMAIGAVYMTSKKNTAEVVSGGAGQLLLPAMLFLTSGTADTLVKFSQQTYFLTSQYDSFLTLIFATSFIFSGLAIALRYPSAKSLLRWKNIIGGILLGLPNYGSIYFFIKTLNTTGIKSAVVFPVNHISIVSITTLAAFFIFKEKISVVNFTGITLAIIAIAVLTIF